MRGGNGRAGRRILRAGRYRQRAAAWAANQEGDDAAVPNGKKRGTGFQSRRAAAGTAQAGRRLAAAILSAALLLSPSAFWTVQAAEPITVPGSTTAPSESGASSGTDAMQGLEEKLAALQAEEAELREKSSAAKQDLDNQQEYKASLDRQIDNAAEQINLLAQQAAALDTQVKETEQEIAAREASIAEKEEENSVRFEQLQQRLRAISKSGNFSMLQMLLSTDSYTDLLIKSKMMQTVAENDQQLMDELDAQIREINSEKEALAADRETLQARQAEYASVQEQEAQKKKELEALSREAASVVEGLEQDMDYYTERLETIRQEEEAMDQLIEDLLNQLPPATTATTTTTTQAATTTTQDGQTTGGTGSTTTTTTGSTTTTTTPTTGPGGQLPTTPGGLYDSGTMYWPVPTVKYVSDFFGGSRNHKGIDIANSPTTPVYGENIVAARDGVVIYANYTNSYGGGYGYYCIVDHGLDADGKRIVTLYAHMSNLIARVGNVVTGGQTVLGQAGNTGNVSGPHLHFEVREDNVCVDPFANGYLIRK